MRWHCRKQRRHAYGWVCRVWKIHELAGMQSCKLTSHRWQGRCSSCSNCKKTARGWEESDKFEPTRPTDLLRRGVHSPLRNSASDIIRFSGNSFYRHMHTAHAATDIALFPAIFVNQSSSTHVFITSTRAGDRILPTRYNRPCPSRLLSLPPKHW